MAVATRPRRPIGTAAVPAPPPLRSVASPTSQALVAIAFGLTFAALGLRMDGAIWFVAPTLALLAGIGLGIRLDLRRWSVNVPGVVAAMVTLVILGLAWSIALGWMAVELPYAPIALAALAAFGTDWWWIERLRPTVVASGALLLMLAAGSGGAVVPLSVAWFAVVAAALWSLRRDALQAVPTPVPVDRSVTPTREPGAGPTAAAVVASWLVAGVLVALGSLIPLAFDSPTTGGQLGIDPGPGGQGAGSGAGPDQPGGGDIGPGEVVQETIGDPVEDRDVNGDGIPDNDINGDGVLDPDIDGDGIPDIDVDGDGVPDATTVPEGAPDATDPPPGAGGDGGTDDVASAPTADGGPTLLRIVGTAVVALLAVALVAVALRALAWERIRRRALATRPWAIRLTERLEDEGARRGRARRRDEPVTLYAAALAGGVLAHERLVEVGDALSAALFAAGTPSDATGEWAVGVVDEAVAANPAPTRRDRLRARRRG